MRHWGIQDQYAQGRMIEIAIALKKLELKSDFRLVDIACGHGLIADGLKWVFPDAKIEQFDYTDEYPEWSHLSVKPYNLDVETLMKRDDKDEHFDVVLFLNSYRNWTMQNEFNEWLKNHARYFITSGREDGEVIGMDTVNKPLKLITL